MFLWWSSTKTVQAIWIRQKTLLPGGGAYFPYIICIENFKNLLFRNLWTDFNIILQKCSFFDPLPRLFKPFGFVKKHGCQGAGLIFPIYLYRKLKKSSCQKPLDRFQYNFAEMFLWWSSQAFKQALHFLLFLLFPPFFMCPYFSLLFSENALLSLLFSPKMFEVTKNCKFFLARFTCLEFVKIRSA